MLLKRALTTETFRQCIKFIAKSARSLKNLKMLLVLAMKQAKLKNSKIR
jgi:hypothetical protein